MSALSLGGPTMVLASEGGGTTYPIGVSTVLPGILPAPGETRYYDYATYYSAGQSNNSAGISAVTGFDVKSEANAFRFLHSWSWKNDGFFLTSGIVVPVVHVDLHAAGRHSDLTGVGDIGLQPLLLNWVNPSRTIFFNIGPNLYVPSGRYEPTRLANTGRNQYTFWPTASVTWFITRQLEASVANTFEVNTTNAATHYHSGDDYDADFELVYRFGGRLKPISLGLNGYAYKQFTDDTVRGVVVGDGHRGQTFSVGPTARLDFGRAGVSFKWQPEFAVRNRPQGDRFWLQFTLPLSPQTRPAPPLAPPVEK